MESPFFQRVLRRLDHLAENSPRLYLHPSKRWEYPWALERAELRGGEEALDAGCGASVFPVFLAREGFSTAAVDVELPRGLDGLDGLSVRYAEGDLAALPYHSDSFDVVFCISVIEHLPRDRMALALGELRRVLRYGGKLLLTTDYYRDSRAKLRYEGPDDSFHVDWNLFDRRTLREVLLETPGLQLAGELDAHVDWDSVSPAMRAFHGYPYTSVGLGFLKV